MSINTLHKEMMMMMMIKKIIIIIIIIILWTKFYEVRVVHNV